MSRTGREAGLFFSEGKGHTSLGNSGLTRDLLGVFSQVQIITRRLSPNPWVWTVPNIKVQ